MDGLCDDKGEVQSQDLRNKKTRDRDKVKVCNTKDLNKKTLLKVALQYDARPLGTESFLYNNSADQNDERTIPGLRSRGDGGKKSKIPHDIRDGTLNMSQAVGNMLATDDQDKGDEERQY